MKFLVYRTLYLYLSIYNVRRGGRDSVDPTLDANEEDDPETKRIWEIMNQESLASSSQMQRPPPEAQEVSGKESKLNRTK